MTRILIVGNGFSSLTDYLRSNGYDYIVLKDRLHTSTPDKKLRNRVVCDFSNNESILSAVQSIKDPIDGVITVYENYIIATSLIARHLGLPGLPEQAAEACTDKFLMRSLFATAPEQISPAFAFVDNEQSLQDFAAQHDFPLMLKPANLAKSLLVTKNDSLDELLANYKRTTAQIQKVYNRYAPHRKPRLLVEEFLQGDAYSVDAFTGKEGEPQVLANVVDYQTGYDIGFDDNFTYSRLLPSRLSPADQEALRHCAAVGIKALGIKNAPSHVELIMTKNGPRIIEIGARNGGYRERMHMLANGINIPGAALALAFGQAPNITAIKNEPCAVLELFPKSPGEFVGIAHVTELQKLPSLTYLSIKPTPGTFVGKSADGYKMCAIIILHHADPSQFERDLQFVNEQVHVITS